MISYPIRGIIITYVLWTMYIYMSRMDTCIYIYIVSHSVNVLTMILYHEALHLIEY